LSLCTVSVQVISHMILVDLIDLECFLTTEAIPFAQPTAPSLAVACTTDGDSLAR
jgi:hypothetical protein